MQSQRFPVKMPVSILLAFVVVTLTNSRISAEEPTPDQLEFFEKKIRPVLVTHCYECHAVDSKNLQGGLLLDSRDGLLAGGDSGPAVVPNDVDESLLISALKFDSFEMPPKGKLPEHVIADFEHWVRDGAADPREAKATAAKPREIDIEAGRSHWAYQPVTDPTIPKVNNHSWPSNEIDHFILARQEAAHLEPTKEADKEVLIRRLYFSLVGLPPTPDEIEAFVSNPSPQAYEQVVDHLLNSPHFGERWGRHWLDVVRYAESVTLRGFVMPEAWRYRDYVIDTFNNDLPFDQFVIEQLAGDLIDSASLEQRQRNLIATTFLTMGNSNLEDQDKQKLEMDFVDEQLDVISRGFLAQTITCARCHDHKFDPIPTRDYYAMAGILKNVKALNHANISKWIEVPLPVSNEVQQKLDAHHASVATLETSIAKLKSQLPTNQKTTPKYQIVAVADLPGIVVDDSEARKVGNWKDSQSFKNYVGNGYCHDEASSKGEKTITFLPKLPQDGRYEVRFAYSHSVNRAVDVPITVFSADGEKRILLNQKQPPKIDGRFVSLGTYRFEVAGQSFVLVENKGTTGHVIADAVQFLPVDETELANQTSSNQTRTKEEETQLAELQKFESIEQEIKSLEAKLKKLEKSAPVIPKTMTVLEENKGEDLSIHIRGNVHNLGEIAPRGVLQVANYGAAPVMPSDESGRLELARWMADPKHPLTSRVMTNRVWHWLFGVGLVRTVDNFGTTGETPSHPELLDYLSTRFVEEGWSVKKLIRSIVMSRTYRISSQGTTPAADPENRLLSHCHRNRLDAESLRDAMLSISGQLDLTPGGRTFPENLSSDYGFQFQEPLRSVYAPVFRNSLPEIFEAFDFANPSMVSGRRNVSTVAPQALFLMNHPFVREQANQTAKRLLAESFDDEETRIDHAYMQTIARHPTKNEREISRDFIESTTQLSSSQEAWTQFVQSLFSSLEFRYLK
ncbi:MAG TPA: hypothetical protein DD473_03775 [Planctomycetaceae bacterium]|nr:hypothetical protein [Planctomycetaceae bacterium]